MSSEKHGSINRRGWLQAQAALGLGAAVPPRALPPAPAHPQPDPERIAQENRQPGTRDWMISHVVIDPKTRYRSPRIEGYASRTSAAAGETISIHVSTNPARPYTAEIYRLGYYQGHGGRLMRALGPFPGRTQPDPPIGPKRLRECRWDAAFEITIPQEWTSGVYLVKLTTQDESPPAQSYAVFIVRDQRPCDYVFQCSDTTWNAYNRWPSQFALYDDGKKEWYWGPDVQCSFDRPYGKYCQIFDAPLSTGSGEFLLWEFPVAYWMEQQGYDVSYISNIDTHADPGTLRRARGMLSVGHDEYWTIEMYDHVKNAISEGLNVAFLSGNAVCGLIELAPASDGRPHRAIERVGLFGGQDDTGEGFPEMRLLTKSAPSEGLLIGARNQYPVTGGADWTCVRPDHWLFAGTGMKAGEGIPGLVGWEWHGDPAPIPGLEVVAEGETTNSSNVKGHYTATIYPGPKGNIVFNASTIWWGDGLSAPPGYVRPAVYTNPRGPDPRVQRITQNLLERMRRSVPT
jgi:hypothetical protein